jgi:WD40 repeat protein
VTKFFEPISASATHIYHSALELCPTSSTVRKLYYDRCNRINHVPRVLVGIPDLWDETISISTGSQYKGCAWSPCGRSIAARTLSDTVEIRNHLTFELLTTLRPTKASISLTGLLAYSPDGRSLACSSPTAIIIWDIQTGGVLKEDQRVLDSRLLAWSLDGSTIGIIDTYSNVHMYEVVSGKTLNLGKLYLGHKGLLLCKMWTHEASFRAVTMAVEHEHQQEITIDIFEIGRTLTKFHSFTFTGHVFSSPNYDLFSFSPATFHFCINTFPILRIFGGQDSNCLLEEDEVFGPTCFSPDGSLFAVSNSIGVCFWKYTSGCYIPWRELRDKRWFCSHLQFSPTLSSILGHYSDVLRMCRLRDLLTTPETPRELIFQSTFAKLVNPGNRIAAARRWENTITLLDVHSQNPPQFVDTDVEITDLSVVGNVLLAFGSGKVVAWLLTEAGLVCGVLGDRRAGHSDSIWTIPYQPSASIIGQEAEIFPLQVTYPVFHTESGELLEDTYQPYSVLRAHEDESSRVSSLQVSNLIHLSAFRSEVPLRSRCQRGWAGSPGGRYILWVPVEWRRAWKYGTWHRDLTAMDMSLRLDLSVLYMPSYVPIFVKF